MEHIVTPHDARPNQRKPKLWERIKRRNTSSPNIHKSDIKNWSTRSLPRLGSFGSCSSGDNSSVCPNSSPTFPSVENVFDTHEASLEGKGAITRDFFSTLPNEVKLRIFTYLPVKTIARASTVKKLVIVLTCRYVSNGGCCAPMVLCLQR